MTDVTNYDPAAEREARERELSTEAIRRCVEAGPCFEARTAARTELAAILKHVEELTFIKDWLDSEVGNWTERDTQLAAVMRKAINQALSHIRSHGRTGMDVAGIVGDLQLALTPDTGKRVRVVDVERLKEIRAVLLLVLDDADTLGLHPKDSTIGDIVDWLAALIGEEA